MKKVTHLLEGKWLSVNKIEWPERHVPGYVYATETSCNGKKVAVLGFRRDPEDNIEFLLRDDYTPSWGDEPIRASITGGVENNDPPGTALLELEEEAGFKVDTSRLNYLGTCYGSKAMDTIYYLYAVRLTGIQQGKPTTENEEEKNNSFCYWTNDPREVIQGEDCMLQAIFARAKYAGLF